MRLGLFVLAILSAANSLKAQWGDSVRVKSSIESSVLLDVGSNSLSIRNYRDYAQASFLSPAFKNELIDQSKDQLRLGNRQSFKLAYQQLNDSVYSQWSKGFEVYLAYNSVLGIASQKDALQLALNGNAPYAGELLELAPTKYQSQSFLSIGFNLIEKRKHLSWSYGFAALFGTDFQDLNLERGSVFTEQNGSYLDLSAQYRYRNSDTLNPIKGMGLGLGGSLQYSIHDQLSLGIELSDFGFIFWNNASYTINADTSFRYLGEFVPNLLDFEGSLFEDTQQGLDDALLTKEGGSFVALTPFNLKANATYLHKDLGKLKSSQVLVEYVYTAGFTPLFRLSSTWAFKRWSLTPDLSYGGFTSMGAGLSTAYETRFWKAKLQLFNAQGFIASSSKALGVQASFFYSF